MEFPFSRGQLRYLVSGGRICVLEHEGRIAGMIVFLVRRYHRLMRIYDVVFEYREDDDLRPQLLEFAEDYARLQGCTHVALEVSESDDDTLLCYREAGYSLNRILSDHYAPGLHARRLIKPLRTA